MPEIKSYKKILISYGKENLFEFNNEELIYVIVGYPHWRAYIVSSEKDFKIEVIPKINIITKKFEFLQDDKREHDKNGNKVEKIALKVKDIETLHLFTEKEKQFFNTIPEEIINKVKLFTDSHWEIIKAITIYGHNFITLIDSNPVLAYLLINLDKINPSFSLYLDHGYLERLITEKQKEILDLADFPGSKSMVKIFSKFDPTLIDVDYLIAFRNILMKKTTEQKQILKLLSHSKLVNKNLLHLIAISPNVSEIISFHALQELIKADSFTELFGVLKIMVAKANKWKIEINIDKIDDITKINQKLEATIQKKIDEANPFPPPPLPDGDGIYALRTIGQQTSWAKRQQNCIRNYLELVCAKRSFFYKVVHDEEEATLEMKLRGKKPSLGTLLAAKNKPVSPELRKIVDVWFEKYSVSKHRLSKAIKS